MPNPQKTFYPAIDTWRGLAALMVCFFHFALYENQYGTLFTTESPIVQIGKYGYLGVYIFFVISGFVIPLSMLNGGYRYRKVGRFIAKRSLRIEPPYLAGIVLFLCLQVFFCRVLWDLPFSVDPKRLLAHVVYAVPFVEGMEWYNAVYWTLAIEFQFYLSCALLFPLWTHRSRVVRHASFILFLVSAAVVTDNRIVCAYAAVFGFGIALFLFRSAFINRFETALYVTMCLVLLYRFNTVEVTVAGICAFALLSLPDFRFKPGRWLGKISYSLYLTHGLTGGNFLMFTFHGDSPYDPLFFVGAFAVSLLSAALFYLVVEKPFQSLSRKMKL